MYKFVIYIFSKTNRFGKKTKLVSALIELLRMYRVLNDVLNPTENCLNIFIFNDQLNNINRIMI